MPCLPATEQLYYRELTLRHRRSSALLLMAGGVGFGALLLLATLAGLWSHHTPTPSPRPTFVDSPTQRV